MIGWLDAVTSVRLSSECVAVRINGDPRIRIWNLSETPKVHGTFLAKNSPAAAWVGEGDEALVLSKTKPEPGKHDTFQLERVDIRKARNSSVPSPLMTVSDRSLFSMDLAGRAAGDWVLYGWGSGRYAASVGAQAAREVWQIKAKSHRSVTLHPTQDEVWMAGSLVDLATGHETRSIPRTGLVSKRLLRPETHWAVWAGEDRVVEPVQSGVNEGGPDAPPPPSKLALWNVRTGTLEACVDAPAVTLVASSPDGKHVLEGGEDRRVRIRNGRTLEVESEARVHDLRVTGAVWHPSKPLVVTASRDGTLRVWNWTEWRLVEEVRIEHGRSWDVQISPSGRRLLVWDFQNDLRVYEPGCFQE
jgi:hypothetical protein